MGQPSTAFIDRDGVINRKPAEGSYVTSAEDLEIIPGAPEAIASLSGAGIRTIIVTNQQGIAKGLLSMQDLEEIHGLIRGATSDVGGTIDQILVCPHLEGTCECRKPRTGLFLEAQRLDPSISFGDSVVIGDSESDIEAASRIGADSIRVGAGAAAEAESLTEAVERLLESAER